MSSETIYPMIYVSKVILETFKPRIVKKTLSKHIIILFFYMRMFPSVTKRIIETTYF